MLDFLLRQVAADSGDCNMPLKRGTSRKTVSGNIRELHEGKTFARTKKKFGAKKANKQAIAIAMSQKRKSAAKKKKKR
jgi:hypothetical protein